MERCAETDGRRCALLTIDVQKDFALPGASFEIPGTAKRLSKMAEALRAAREAGMLILHVVRLYKKDGSNAEAFRLADVLAGRGPVLAGSEGAELPEELLPRAGGKLDAELLLSGGFQSLGPREWVMYKPRFGAFYQTDLEAFLRNRGVDTLVFSGCNFPNCPRTSLYEAGERDFGLAVLRDALSGLYERGEEELKGIGVRMFETADWAKRITDR